MSNSKLVNYTLISPNKTSPRNRSISKITIHHMAGNLSVESCGNVFQAPNGASANYGVGSDGRVGLYVDEADRSWASSSASNDNVAVTIEVANSTNNGPSWPVSDTALGATIDLCVDICRRNGIQALNYNGTASGTLTQHNFFTNTICPGPYLEACMSDIAYSVNLRLEECSDIESAVEAAANQLMNQGIINTPSYWVENFGAIRNLGYLLIKMGAANKRTTPVTSVTGISSALNRLQSRGVIDSPDFWLANYYRLQYLEELIINVAKYVA